MSDIADRGSALEQKQRNAAIKRVVNRQHGEPLLDENGNRICRDCEELIPLARIEAAPHAVRCVPCKPIREGGC